MKNYGIEGWKFVLGKKRLLPPRQCFCFKKCILNYWSLLHGIDRFLPGGRKPGAGADPRGRLATPILAPFCFLYEFICFLLHFYICWNRYCLRDVNIFINAKHNQSQNGSLNYLDFCQSIYFDSFNSPPLKYS